MNLTRITKIMESRWFFVLTVLLFRLSLDAAYVAFVSPWFGYEGFGITLSSTKYLESWVLLFAVACYTPCKLKRPSDYLLVTFLLTVLVPILAFYGLNDQSRTHLYIVLAGYFTMALSRLRPPIRLPYIQHGFVLGLALTIVSCITVTAWLVWSGGLRYFNLDLSKVYEFREAVGSLTNVGPMNYLNTWAMKVFGPLLLAMALLHRRWWLAACAIGLHVLWFGISAHKSVLFFPILILFVWYWFRKTQALSFYAVGSFFVVLMSLAAYMLVDNMMLGSLFVRRSFFVVAKNTFDYYDFFAQNGFIWWSNSILSPFLEYPYYLSPADLIGSQQGTDSHVNTSFISTGYMHGGLFGVILYCLLVGLIFRVIDSLSKGGLEAWFCISVTLVPMWALLRGADLLTALLSHGVAVAILLLMLIRRKRRPGAAIAVPQSHY